MTPRAFQINSSDSVAVLLDDAQPGPVSLLGSPGAPLVSINHAIRLGHKMAVRPHAVGEAVIKYGVRIGHATEPIAVGDWIHLHNCASDLDERSNTLEVTTGAPTDTIYE
jgi:altronate hydrolase/altronate dehydratase small subunit